jgi:hypothetical protein
MDNTLNIIKNIDNIKPAQVISCTSDDFSKLLEVKNTDFTIIAQNIRSVYANIDDLKLNIATLKSDIDLIVLSECRINPNKTIPQIGNYKHYHTTNHLNKADGVVVYVKNTYKVKVNEIHLTHASCLQISVSPDITILGIYRSPSNTKADDFIDSLNRYLNFISLNNNIIITGDININLIHNQNELSHERSNRLGYLNMLAMHALQPGHLLPTRGKSCLDHFILKINPTNKTTIAVLNTTITDHQMIFLKLSNQVINKNSIKTKSTLNLEKAVHDIKEIKLSELLDINDPNTLTNCLVQKLQLVISLNTITQNITQKCRIIKPWMTVGLLRCIWNRNNMQKKLKVDPDNGTLRITYKRYRNYCNLILKKRKRQFDREQLEKAHKNPRKTWQVINYITQRKERNSQSTGLLETESTPHEAVDKVNSYFSSVGKLLADDIKSLAPQVTGLNTYSNNVVNPLVSSFAFFYTDPDEVRSVLMALKSDSAPGWDKIPTCLLKAAHKEIVPIIAHLANLCFEQGTFPLAFKEAIVTPVHKSGDETIMSNYRPISVLPSISKILEKLINTRLLNYLSKHGLLSPTQYGFRRGKCTEDAILALTSLITGNVDSGNRCLAVFLDLKKAFDTVSVTILLQKLEMIGIRGTALSLFTDYLSGRRQRVKIAGFTSSDKIVNYGVPQGSVLGPTLFLIYINSLSNMIMEGGHVFSYADDTVLVFSGKTWDVVKTFTEAGLLKVANWLDMNLLTLNALKTNYICFCIDDRTQPPTDFEIKIHKCMSIIGSACSCTKIDKVKNTKYLGIMLDQRLSWHAHIELIMSRTRKLIWVFKILRHVATVHLLKQIYISLAQSVISYCLPVWGGASKLKFLDLERAQRSLLKVIYFRPYRFPTEDLYLSSGHLSVRKLYLLQVVLKKHKSLSFVQNQVVSRRKKNVAPIVSVKSTFAKRQYSRQSSHLYNIINKELSLYPMTLFNCKKSLMEWLVDKSYDDIEKLVQTINM